MPRPVRPRVGDQKVADSHRRLHMIHTQNTQNYKIIGTLMRKEAAGISRWGPGMGMGMGKGFQDILVVVRSHGSPA